MRYNVKRIQGKLHIIGTYDVCKMSLSCFDDKRYILDHGINSLERGTEGKIVYFFKCVLKRNKAYVLTFYQDVLISFY